MNTIASAGFIRDKDYGTAEAASVNTAYALCMAKIQIGPELTNDAPVGTAIGAVPPGARRFRCPPIGTSPPSGPSWRWPMCGPGPGS